MTQLLTGDKLDSTTLEMFSPIVNNQDRQAQIWWSQKYKQGTYRKGLRDAAWSSGVPCRSIIKPLHRWGVLALLSVPWRTQHSPHNKC